MSDWTFGPHLLNQHRVNARPRDGDHQNLLASSIWRSIVTPDKIRQDPLAVVALPPKNDDTIELFSLRLSNRQTFLRGWKQGKHPSVTIFRQS